ncbi:MAG: hypothetical protein GY771_17115, partial [bacterium]|nr:hypothetical protein [bacterium]
MRYLKIKIVLLFALILGIPSVAKEGGDDDGGEEGETTAVVSSGYTSQRSEDGINASLGYTNNLTKNLLFRFDVGLSNRFNTTENREIESHLVGLSSKYDPPSPWKLDVRYNYNRSYNYRPEEINQDEYLAYTRSHSLGSSLSYAFTESVRTYLDVNLSKSEMESKVAGESNPDTDSNQNSIDSLVEYDITPSTAVNVRYSGGIDSTEYSGSSERVADPPPPPKKGRTQRHSVYGSIVSNNSITDNFNLDMSLNVNDATKRDELLPGLDSDALSRTASNAISYDLASKVSLSNRVNLSRKLFTYHNKKEYRDEFSKNIYDTDDTTLLNASELTIQPSGSTSVSVAYDINFEKRYRYIDRIRGLMPTEVSDPKAAGNIYEDIEQKLVSKVNTAIGEDLTFHLTYYYSSS